MLDFNRSDRSDFQDYGRWLWQQADQFNSHEAVSQFITQSLFEEFMVDGQPQVALARIFRLTPCDELPSDLRKRARGNEEHILTLTGTYGLEPAWCDRRNSKNHALISLSEEVFPAMFGAVLEQFGVDLYYLRTQGVIGTGGYRGQYHIPDASDGRFVPEQDTFVRPYQICSTLGFSGFIQGMRANRPSLYFLSVFTLVPVSEQTAADFCGLQEYIGTALSSRPTHSGVFSAD